MAQYIEKDALVAKIEDKINKYTKRGEESDAKHDGHGMYWGGVISCLNEIRSLLDTIEVKEIKLPNPLFPHLNNIVDKVFGTGNLESLEYEEAEQLVLLAKEELLKDLEVKELDLEKEFNSFLDDVEGMPRMWHSDEQMEWGFDIARHFFNLGLKARKE